MSLLFSPRLLSAFRYTRRLLAVSALLLGIVLLACGSSVTSEPGAVHVLTVDGNVDPVLERYIDRGISQAEKKGAAAVVIRLDTPGGLVTSMEDIVQRLLGAEVPVIVYVWPPGAQAASAGTFITMAGHIAAMAPSTRIGAASPVGASGEDIEGTLGEKVTNDLVALIKGIAEARGRNAEWGERAVREAVSATQTEAVDLNVVDLVATDLDSLLRAVDESEVRLPSGTVTLRTIGAPVDFNNMNLFERFLSVISDPNIAFLLLSLGSLGILIELLSPGHIAPGVFGAVALIVGFFAVGTLPVNYAFLALILLAFVLFALEVFVASHGILAIGGLISLGLGGTLFLSSEPGGPSISPWLVWGTTAVIGGVLAFMLLFVFANRWRPVPATVSPLIGAEAEVRRALDPTGVVYTAGELWSAESEDGHVAAGDRVVVTGVEGLKLRVRKKE